MCELYDNACAAHGLSLPAYDLWVFLKQLMPKDYRHADVVLVNHTCLFIVLTGLAVESLGEEFVHREGEYKKEPCIYVYPATCEHGKLLNDYCQPCGRVNGQSDG